MRPTFRPLDVAQTMKRKILRTIESLIRREEAFRRQPFLAPFVRGGRICVRIAGVLHRFRVLDPDFSGWGVFEAWSEGFARLKHPASPQQVERYLSQLKPLVVILCRRINDTDFSALPANRSDMRQRFGRSRAVLVRLCENVHPFDLVVARSDGCNFWFEDIYPSADPRIAEYLRRALQEKIPAHELSFPHLTPEMRAAYSSVLPEILKQQPRAEKVTPAEAVRRAGGTADYVADEGDEWLVEWRSMFNRRYSTWVRKGDLTVESAGICLSGMDDQFDLQSLVSAINELQKEIWSARVL